MGICCLGGHGVVWVFNEPLSLVGPKGTHHWISGIAAMLEGPTGTFGPRNYLFWFRVHGHFWEHDGELLLGWVRVGLI